MITGLVRCESVILLLVLDSLHLPFVPPFLPPVDELNIFYAFIFFYDSVVSFVVGLLALTVCFILVLALRLKVYTFCTTQSTLRRYYATSRIV